ncbi:alanine racemase C-terminal domain-containing protein [Microbacterium sp. WCS2018Hpa-23]|uniref:alanine racemase C-terminal domain-containing protein n=1 Tax=Microbacterium sp. WCS2018Hpa-23 TaxID=3073634 RepID=UPI0028834643|nr:alanine racemase C-terminal domain-containing protein [Microbacterium sp. WCS2018Hpa-23]
MCEKTSSSRPRAMISRSALAASASAAVDAGGRIADLRRDAWGHGVLAIAHAVTGAGAAAVLVDYAEEAEMLRLEGIEAVTEGAADIDPSLLYGLPDAEGTLRTTPVMRLAGRILSTKPLKAGDAVSYGYTHRASRDTTAALITGGYAQGIVRALGNAAHVEIDGVQRPIVGRVAMDVCVIDLQGSSEAQVGVDATYFGGTGPAGPGLARWSAVTGLTIAELITVAGSHAERGWEA